ncbi:MULTISPECIES: OsmC family protein [unclassified Agrococcus]|uniref:OsmC family protein n=1 Tax=unclassified Agrococcus TaxID=2615065 RepID=UPI00361DCC74
MSIDTTTQALPDASADERASRLTTAASTWGDRIAADRTAAHLRYRVTGTGEGAVATRLEAGRHAFWVDEPAALAGDDVAASPVEVALGALIACQVVVYRLYAHALAIPFDDIRITAEGDLDAARLLGADESVRAGFSAIRLAIAIDGPETQERYEQLRDAVDAHCPVLDLFANPTPVTATIAKA